MLEYNVVHTSMPAAKRRPQLKQGQLTPCAPAPKRRPDTITDAGHPANSFPIPSLQPKRAAAFTERKRFDAPVNKSAPRVPTFSNKRPWAKTIMESKDKDACPNISDKLQRAIDRRTAQIEVEKERLRIATMIEEGAVLSADEKSADRSTQTADHLTNETEEQAEQEAEPPPTAAACEEGDGKKGFEALVMSPKGRVIMIGLAVLCLAASVGAAALSAYICVNLVLRSGVYSEGLAIFLAETAALLGVAIIITVFFGSVFAVSSSVNCCRACPVSFRKVVWQSLMTIGVFAVSVCIVAGFRAGRPVRYRFDEEIGGYTAYAGIPYWDRSIVIPDTYKGKPVKTLCENGFANDLFLKEVTVGANIETIGSWAFENCKNLQSVTFRSSVKEIDSWAFDGCKNLHSVTFGSDVGEIGYKAFEGCKNLHSVTFGSDVGEIDSRAFEGCENLRSVTFLSPTPPDKEILEAFYMGGDYIPHDIHFYVPAAAYPAYRLAWHEIEVGNADHIIPLGLTDNHFYIVDNELVYSIYDQLDEVEAGEVVVPDGVSVLGERTFRYCSPRAVRLPASVETIEKGAFGNQYVLCIVTVDAVEPPMLVEDVFSDTSLHIILVPDASVEAYRRAPGWSAYADRIMGLSARNGKLVMSGDTLVEYIGYGPTKRLEDNRLTYGYPFSLPEGIVKIGDLAFYRNEYIGTVCFPQTLKEIGDKAFAESGLFSTVLPSADMPRTVLLPATIERVGNNAFEECRFVDRVIIEGETMFAEDEPGGPFSGCEYLKEMEFGEKVARLSSNIFSGCEALETIFFEGSVPPAFDDLIFPRSTVYVPAASLETYREALAGQTKIEIVAR